MRRTSGGTREAAVATKMNARSQRKGQCGVEKQGQLGGHQNADWVGSSYVEGVTKISFW